ncbi:MAG TPA: hypothetical protein PLI95_21700 [Polyangiaceae bacterium]|nr:hypothetical protein [Polyangiaceae bacterium]
MEHETCPALRAMQERKIRRSVARVIRWMSMAPHTYRRREVADEIEAVLKEVDRALGGLPDSIPRRRRALLLLPQQPVVLDPAFYEYVTGVVRGDAVTELQELVVRTGSLELMQRFSRYALGCDRAGLKREMLVVEVMTG